jgi:predicted DNA-binding transcriptional regulator AlpA
VLVVEEMVGATEVADMLGVTRSRVHQLAQRESFPKPVAVLRAGFIWRRVDIERWMRSTGRDIPETD